MSAPGSGAGERGITIPAHHLVGMDLGFTCTNCGEHASITPPCIPAKVYPLPATPDADDASECRCQPCPGRGNEGHGWTHCAECCFGTGVEAEPGCPLHYPAPAATPDADDASKRVGSRLRCTACGEWGHLNAPCPASTDASGALTEAERVLLLSVERDEDAVAAVERIVAARESAAATRARAEGAAEALALRPDRGAR